MLSVGPPEGRDHVGSKRRKSRSHRTQVRELRGLARRALANCEALHHGDRLLRATGVDLAAPVDNDGPKPPSHGCQGADFAADPRGKSARAPRPHNRPPNRNLSENGYGPETLTPDIDWLTPYQRERGANTGIINNGVFHGSKYFGPESIRSCKICNP